MKKNTKIIRLTENDLERMVKRIIKEDSDKEVDLINAAYELMYDLGYEYVEDLYIQDLQDAANILEDELYDGNHGSIMDQKIEDLLTYIYEVIGYPDDEEYESEEDYMEDMPKPGIGQKLKQSLRDLSGIGNKNDNATLKQIHALIAKGAVDNVRRQPNGITAWVNNKALILDIEVPEIIYAGRNLEVANLESKVLDLYSELLDFI